MTNSTPYILTKEAQQHLKNASTSLWQAYCLLEAVKKSCSQDGASADMFIALDGIQTLMSNGLNDLGEV